MDPVRYHIEVRGPAGWATICRLEVRTEAVDAFYVAKAQPEYDRVLLWRYPPLGIPDLLLSWGNDAGAATRQSEPAIRVNVDAAPALEALERVRAEIARSPRGWFARLRAVLRGGVRLQGGRAGW